MTYFNQICSISRQNLNFEVYIIIYNDNCSFSNAFSSYQFILSYEFILS